MKSHSRSEDDGPRVSVLMSVYNAGAYLEAAVASILEQSYTDFEFLIHDDGSTDNSLDILKACAERDPRVHVSTGPNQGVPAAINRLLAQANGEFIARFDADDISLPERLARQVAYLDTHPDVVALGTSYVMMDMAGRLIAPKIMPQGHAKIDEKNLRGQVALHQPTVMMRWKALDTAGGYDESFLSSQDHDLWLRMGEVGELANLPDVLLRYRVHSGSISGGKSEQQKANCLRACEKAWARRGIGPQEFAYRPWRMEDTRDSKISFYMRYAWQAWSNGYRETWRHYALEVLKLAPFSLKTWKLLIVGAFRRPAR